jgi:hypothetical protein
MIYLEFFKIGHFSLEYNVLFEHNAQCAYCSTLRIIIHKTLELHWNLRGIFSCRVSERKNLDRFLKQLFFLLYPILHMERSTITTVSRFIKFIKSIKCQINPYKKKQNKIANLIEKKNSNLIKFRAEN